MNIRDLKYLLALAELRSFSLAAEQCHVSQPTLSSQVKKLEEQLGVQLFERTNKRVLPTAVGEQIIASAERIIREVDSLNDIAEASIDPLSGRFRLGAFPTLATYVFPGIVKPIKTRMPNLKLILIEEKTATLVEKLTTGEIDAALLALPLTNKHFNVQKLFDDYFRLAVPKNHELAKISKVGQSSLFSKNLLLLEEGHCLRDQALDVCGLVGANEERDFRATGLETLRLMVKAGTGITLMPEIAIGGNDEDISYIPFKEPRPKRTIGLVWRKTLVKTNVIEELIKIFIS
ncbi:MAG: LysR family transcriptional regulator [Pseudomonadales bacterium]|nr:LysR family transcriptional regulator [Pseudomonadales bacterium]